MAWSTGPWRGTGPGQTGTGKGAPRGERRTDRLNNPPHYRGAHLVAVKGLKGAANVSAALAAVPAPFLEDPDLEVSLI